MTFAAQFEAIKNQKTLMVGLLFLLVIVVFWVGLSLFGSQTKFAVPKEMRDLAKPLTPTIKDATLTRIGQKRQYQGDELSGFTIYKILEDKARGGQGTRLVDINYEPPAESVTIGTEPTPKDGGLSSYLETNPDLDATPPSDVSAPPADQSSLPAESAPTGEAVPDSSPPTTPESPTTGESVEPTPVPAQ